MGGLTVCLDKTIVVDSDIKQQNQQTNITNIFFSGNLREELVGSGITDVIKQLTTHEDEKVREDAKSLEKYIEELTVER